MRNNQVAATVASRCFTVWPLIQPLATKISRSRRSVASAAPYNVNRDWNGSRENAQDQLTRRIDKTTGCIEAENNEHGMLCLPLFQSGADLHAGGDADWATLLGPREVVKA